MNTHTDTNRISAVPDLEPSSADLDDALITAEDLPPTGAEYVARYRACERCGGSPAVHNAHPLNTAYVGHDYI